MKIRIVDFCRKDYDSFNSNSFIFNEKSSAVLLAQELLSSELEDSWCSDEYNFDWEEIYIEHYGEYNNAFIIKVVQKEIK